MQRALPGGLDLGEKPGPVEATRRERAGTLGRDELYLASLETYDES